MASIIRPTMLRQACLTAATRRAFLVKPSPTLINRGSPSVVSNLSTFQGKHFITAVAFHTSSRKNILPPGPQVIEGTANDPAPIPPTDPSHGSYHWSFERLISVALIPLTIAPFAAGSLNPTMDAILCASIIIHSHIGFESMIIDYIPRKRLPRTRLFFWWGLRAATLVVAVGLYEFETNDVGLTEAIKRIWVA